MKRQLKKIFGFIFGSSKRLPVYETIWRSKWSEYLERSVSFYQNLDADERQLFERRTLLFLHSTAVNGGVAVTVTDEDKLLIAASAIIPVWKFPKKIKTLGFHL